LQSSRKGVLSIIVSAILLFSGILTGLHRKLLLISTGAVERCLPLENVFNATNTWANVKLDIINMLIPFVIAILASYVFFGEGS